MGERVVKTDKELIDALNRAANHSNLDMKQEPDERPWIDADTFEAIIGDLSEMNNKDLAKLIAKDLHRAANKTRNNQLRKENERLKQELNLLKGK